jgi:hypothetical protein
VHFYRLFSRCGLVFEGFCVLELFLLECFLLRFESVLLFTVYKGRWTKEREKIYMCIRLCIRVACNYCV